MLSPSAVIASGLQPRGPYQGSAIIGEVTEAVHAFIKDGWPDASDPPRVVEDLDFEPKDRERIVYVYMYRVAKNTALLNSKRWRESRVQVGGDDDETARHFYERPPLYLDLYYLISVHAKFRSEAEKLLGWLLLRLNEATHLVYRPRRYTLPDQTEVDSTGRAWSIQNRGEGVVMEKVSVDLVDDLTIGDAVNFFNIHDAPFRPYVTYRARCAMEGALVEAVPTTVKSAPVADATKPPAQPTRPPGRNARAKLAPARPKTPFGPKGFGHRSTSDDDDNHEG
jgi:hypothetical protein